MMRQPEGSPVAAALLRDYEYDQPSRCLAGDGSCAIACPLGINTGVLMKHFRHMEHTHTQEYAAEKLAEHWGAVEKAARVALTLNEVATRVFGGLPAKGMTSAARAIVSNDLMPAWLPNIPQPAKVDLPSTERTGAAACLLLSLREPDLRKFRCLREVAEPCASNGRRVRASETAPRDPGRPGGQLLSTVWHSKGYADGNEYMANKVVESLWCWSDGGQLPVVCDASSCTLGITSEILDYLTMENRERHKRLTLLDSIAWANDYLLPRLKITRRVGSVVVHPVCATHHLGLSDKLNALGAALSEQSVTPIYSTCCAFAGDRGFLHPEAHPLGNRGTGRGAEGPALRPLRLQQSHLRDRHESGDWQRLPVGDLPPGGVDPHRIMSMER